MKITNQIVERGHFNLVGKLHGVRPNIDLILKGVKLHWNRKGNIEIIALPNDYMIFLFNTMKDRDYVLGNPWFCEK